MKSSRLDAAVIAALVLAGCAGGGHIPVTATQTQRVQSRSMARFTFLRGVPTVVRPGVRIAHGTIPHPSGPCGTSLQFMSDNVNNAVLEYSGSSVPCKIITTQMNEPEGMAIDKKAVLYVVNAASSDVIELKPPYNTVYKTLQDPGEFPAGVVTCGTYVAVTNLLDTNGGPGSVSIYIGGATTPSYILQDPNVIAEYFPACDGKGNLYTSVSYTNGGGGVNVWYGHTGSATDTGLLTMYPGGIAYYQSTLWVIDQAGSLDAAVAPFSSFEDVIPLNGAGDPVGLAIMPNGVSTFLVGDAAKNVGDGYDIEGDALATFDGLNPGQAIFVTDNRH